jgi:hypothetical protein
VHRELAHEPANGLAPPIGVAMVRASALELLEQPLHLAVVLQDDLDCVHAGSPLVSGTGEGSAR